MTEKKKNLILQIIAGLFILALIVSGVIQVQKEKEQVKIEQEKASDEYKEDEELAERLKRVKAENKKQRDEFYSLIEEFMINEVGLKEALRDERFQKYIIDIYSEGYLNKMKQLSRNVLFKKQENGVITAYSDEDLIKIVNVTIDTKDTTKIIPLEIKMECCLREYDIRGKIDSPWELIPGKDEFGDFNKDYDKLMSEKIYKEVESPESDYGIKISYQRNFGLLGTIFNEVNMDMFSTILQHVEKIRIKSRKGKIIEIPVSIYDDEIKLDNGFLALLGEKSVKFNEFLWESGEGVTIAFITVAGNRKAFKVDNYYYDLLAAFADNGFKFCRYNYEF